MVGAWLYKQVLGGHSETRDARCEMLAAILVFTNFTAKLTIVRA